ncbi:serine hydrolase domain-containing protein [Kribbella sp. NPDC051587]|uniref:serine hydrolase domain-containing protein n=1 Tax=Kribbella sp. NPDC051587 TaxID=3364119 RepID=UPI0037A9B2B7
MQSVLDKLVPQGAAGVLLHLRTPDVTWTGSSGVGELGTDRPVDPDGWFRAGSITKTFTAVVVLQLVGAGRLQLDKPITEWVPDVPTDITLRQLLNHTSGLHNYTDDLPDLPGMVRDRFLPVDPFASLATAVAKPRLFEAGSSWSYSNTNYIALGLLIEAVTGNLYADEVRDRIIQPAGLSRTLLPGDDVELPDPHAHAYFQLDDGPVDMTQVNVSQAWAAGAIVSTAADLNTFYAKLLAGDLLRTAELAEMQTVVDVADGYGLGIERRVVGDHVLWGHGGGIFGYRTLSYHSSDVDLTLSYTTMTEEGLETDQVLAGLLT